MCGFSASLSLPPSHSARFPLVCLTRQTHTHTHTSLLQLRACMSVGDGAALICLPPPPLLLPHRCTWIPWGVWRLHINHHLSSTLCSSESFYIRLPAHRFLSARPSSSWCGMRGGGSGSVTPLTNSHLSPFLFVPPCLSYPPMYLPVCLCASFISVDVRI